MVSCRMLCMTLLHNVMQIVMQNTYIGCHIEYYAWHYYKILYRITMQIIMQSVYADCHAKWYVGHYAKYLCKLLCKILM
jgi:hypothetical protein